MHLTIKMASGGVLELSNISNSASVSELKGRIASELNIFADQQRLMFAGKELNFGLLKDFGVINRATLHLVAAMHSGPLYAAKRSALFDRKDLQNILRSLTEEQVAFLLQQKKPVTISTRIADHLVVFTLMPSDIESTSTNVPTAAANPTVVPFQQQNLASPSQKSCLL